MSTQKAWLPNLVSGVSVWKLADDLNAPAFMDGRLLVPETEGAESLPTEVRWNVEGLLPLEQAQHSHPEPVARAIAEFQEILARAEKALAAEDSGYQRFREALTMPSLSAGGEAHYYFDPTSERLKVKNWGASPRDLAGGTEAVFGLGRLREVLAAEAPVPAAGSVAAAGAALAGAAAAVADTDPAEQKAEEPKTQADEHKPGAVWPWLVAVLLGVLLLGALLLGLRQCNRESSVDAADAGEDAGAEDAGAEDAGAEDAGAEDAGEDAGAGDAGAEDAGAEDAGAEDAGDAGAEDAGDGGSITTLLFDDDAGAGGGGGGGGGGLVVVPGGGQGGGGGGGDDEKVYVAPDQKGGGKGGTHRVHAQPGAQAWRVSQGADRVARAEQKGANFDVWLVPGASFEGVVVEWRDKEGNWNVH